MYFNYLYILLIYILLSFVKAKVYSNLGKFNSQRVMQATYVDNIIFLLYNNVENKIFNKT